MTSGEPQNILPQTELLERTVYSNLLPNGVESAILSEVLKRASGNPFQLAFSLTENASMAVKTVNVYKHVAGTGDDTNAAGLTCVLWQNLTRNHDAEMAVLLQCYRPQAKSTERKPVS